VGHPDGRQSMVDDEAFTECVCVEAGEQLREEFWAAPCWCS